MSFTYCAFRMAADASLALTIPVLLYRIHKNGSSNISLSTQIMHCIAFVARYLDLFIMPSMSVYNAFMRFYIILGSLLTVGTLVVSQRPIRTQQRRTTLAQVLSVVLPSLCLAFFVNYNWTPPNGSRLGNMPLGAVMEIAWAFSMYTAALADIPQLMEYGKMEIKDSLLTKYLLLCFAFRGLYLPHWVLRWFDERRFDYIAVFSALVQTLIYIVYGFFIIRHHSRRQMIAADTTVHEVHFSTLEKGAVDEKAAALAEIA
ncbi:ER lumen protein retaining receptor [Heliocybe sulcata]|uniref:ER lumen protein retaining receptor n=1 Tax=Heliocybe sulcata TaxID=5364 RepID=A0A5C3MMG8_9AGAM|nr:ER lumen protein retaining receptor [Heliocybe sulcata]